MRKPWITTTFAAALALALAACGRDDDSQANVADPSNTAVETTAATDPATTSPYGTAAGSAGGATANDGDPAAMAGTGAPYSSPDPGAAGNATGNAIGSEAGNGMSGNDARASFVQHDADGDGTISQQEAQGPAGLGERFTVLDRNGDAQVTREEWDLAQDIDAEGIQ